jgi:tetratricopeptide (TPR) repeat protein
MNTDIQARCDEARRHAEAGDHARAAALFEAILELGDVPERGQAALGLAVVREDAGDLDGARTADRLAIATGDAEYAPRATYHLALSYERTGERDAALRTWQRLVEFGNPAYLSPARLALAHLADEDGDFETAREHWEQVVAGGDERYAPVAAHDLAHRLLERGETARAQRLLAEVLRGVDPAAAPHPYARLAVTMGLAHLDQAIGAFSAALGTGDAEIAPLAVELLARTLPLRGRSAESGEVWADGLADPVVGGAVQARLRREFGQAEPAGLWWEPYVEAAVRDGAVPALTGELFGALDHLYSLIAIRYAEGPAGLPAETYDLLGEAVAVPEEYPWGGTLRESFTERLQEALGVTEPDHP